MKISKTFLIAIIVATALFGSVSYISWAYMQNRKIAKLSKEPAEGKLPKIDYDKALLKRFELLNRSLDPNGENFHLSGILSVSYGGADPNRATDLAYQIIKQGGQYYCKMGATETLNTERLNITLDHSNKYIMVSAPKELPYSQLFPNAKELVKNLHRERYELNDILKDGKPYLSLRNNYHISCKEYGISYQMDGLRPLKLFMRLSDLDHPEQATKDKVILLQIKDFGTESKWHTVVSPSNFIKELDGKWQLTNAFSQYRLYIL